MNWLLERVKEHRPVDEIIEEPTEEDLKQQVEKDKTWEKEFNFLRSYVNLHETLERNKMHFPQNECNIDRINQLDNAYNIVVKDEHCPILNNLPKLRIIKL